MGGVYPVARNHGNCKCVSVDYACAQAAVQLRRKQSKEGARYL